MGRLFDGPWPMIIIAIVALLFFASPKLPAMARSLGQSMRIIKSEVKEMKNDDGPADPEASRAKEDVAVQLPSQKADIPNRGSTAQPPYHA
ncbi:Sec-independent protein translocase subunit TatA [Arthrobacter sp. R4]|uniref:Sec-independent protein translocase subunit TatA n=1 Tax=Arthrobacter sp. R4 TaxID=644417 RepID=UPI003EDB0F05